MRREQDLEKRIKSLRFTLRCRKVKYDTRLYELPSVAWEFRKAKLISDEEYNGLINRWTGK